MERLRKANLRLKAQKCKFMRDKVGYLGHVVSKEGIEADPAKVFAVRDFPTPKDLKSLRSFLGLAAYYRRFVPLFSTVAGPLHGLTRKGVDFVWSESCEEAFRTLKRLLTQAPVLAFPDFSLGFLLETDASGLGLGAVLAQEQDGVVWPIAYSSRTLQAHEKNYGATELEGLVACGMGSQAFPSLLVWAQVSCVHRSPGLEGLAEHISSFRQARSLGLGLARVGVGDCVQTRQEECQCGRPVSLSPVSLSPGGG